jgi:hypothetical protein
VNRAVIISLIRTVVVPTLVGWVGQALIFFNSEEVSDSARAAVTAVVGLVWYLIAKFAAAVNPKWGVLLLIAAQPKYVEDGNGDEVQAQSDMLLSVVRTVVPLAAGWGITALLRLGIEIDDTTAVLVLQGAVTSAYYGALRWIEEFAKRRGEPTATSATAAGVLLGAPANLTY